MPINPNELSMSINLKTSFKSLIKQLFIVFVGFILLLKNLYLKETMLLLPYQTLFWRIMKE